MERLRVPERMSSRSSSGRVLLILDEFGEVLNVPGEPDALMRSAFQDSPDVSFLFMGSKRSLMDRLLSDRKRPFFNFGRRIELRRLPYEELGDFVEQGFKAAGKVITPEAAGVVAASTDASAGAGIDVVNDAEARGGDLVEGAAFLVAGRWAPSDDCAPIRKSYVRATARAAHGPRILYGYT